MKGPSPMTRNHLAEASLCANTASRTSSTTLSGVEAPDVTPRVNDPSGSHSFESHCTRRHVDIGHGDKEKHSKFRIRVCVYVRDKDARQSTGKDLKMVQD